MTDLAARLRAGDVVVLDGGLATTLETRGVDISGHLWSARVMLEAPEAIAAAQRDFLAAGAQVVTTSSYQASHAGFGHVGLSADQVDALLRTDARRAREVAARWQNEHPSSPPIAVVASIGPYGAALADGSEYRGDYDVPAAALRDFHARRLAVLADECDIFACETIPQLAETEVLLELLAEFDVPAWLSVSAVGDRLRSGEPAAEAFAMAADVPAVVAAGANCIHPRDAADLAHLASTRSGKPAVIYPNSGEDWQDGAWHGDGVVAEVDAWLDAGARLVGGCCRVTPADIATVAAAVAARATAT